MAWFVVSYDLRKQRNYQPLYDKFAEWGAVRALESFWLVDVTGRAEHVRDALRALIDSDDGLLVVELKPNFDWALLRTLNGASDWLKSRSP